MNTEKSTDSVLLQGSGPINPPDPAAVIAAWPAQKPLVALTNGRILDGPRWTIIASPTKIDPINSPDDLDELLVPGSIAHDSRDSAPPFRNGRILLLSYTLGKLLEPITTHRISDSAPLGFVLGCPATAAFDHERQIWSGHGPGAAELLDTIRSTASRENLAPDFRLGAIKSELGEQGYRRMVRAALDLIAAGDVYQVNLTHRLSAEFHGNPRALAAALLDSATPLHGCYAEVPDGESGVRNICSASPELFLSFDPTTRIVRTSPMKGTRPISCFAEELRTAEKDRAELNMITDLMRNDLGRVCDLGSVRVERVRTIEAHGRSVWQATSTVSGRLRDRLGIADLVRAAFPPGSVTGAPKVRAMQIIDELEPIGRGMYCGAIGWMDDSGAMSLNVAIRTAEIAGDRISYRTGAGIVADSQPGAEWAETLEKAEVLSRLTS